jgi:uncharacterized membrane protein
MNGAHWHLVLNHLPIVGTLLGSLILIAGYLVKNNVVKQTALAVFVFSALLAVPAFLTGEEAEEIVERIPGVNETIIEEHEESASIYIWIIGSLGVLSLITLYADKSKRSFAKLLYGITLVMAVSTAVISQRLGTTGGEIRHSEITAQGATELVTPAAELEKEEEDDH